MFSIEIYSKSENSCILVEPISQTLKEMIDISMP